MSPVRLALLSGATIAAALPAAAAAAPARLIEFFAGNNCRGARAFAFNGDHARESCKANRPRCRNDVARSMRVHSGPQYALVSVYDDPEGERQRQRDDSTSMYIAPHSNICVGTFERQMKSPGFSQQYVRKDGLDGKVSYVSIVQSLPR